VIGLLFVGLGLYAVGSLGASIGSRKGASVTEYQYPDVELNANPLSVPAGSDSTLTWTTTNVDSCEAYGDWSGSKPLSGSESVLVWGWEHGFYDLECSGIWGDGGSGAFVQSTAPLALRAVVDQRQSHVDDIDTRPGFAQTFTVGVSGWLTDINVNGTGTNPSDVLAITRTTQSGAPSGTVLYSTTLVHQSTVGNVHLTKPIFVLAGQHYAITVVAPNGLTDPQNDYTYYLYACEGSSYSRGTSYYLDKSGGWIESPGCDDVFTTWVVQRIKTSP
jgi:hypothetical protein